MGEERHLKVGEVEEEHHLMVGEVVGEHHLKVAVEEVKQQFLESRVAEVAEAEVECLLLLVGEASV